MMRNRLFQVLLCAIVIGAVFAGGLALAGKPPKPTTNCKWWNLACLDVWDPVICNDGQVYSNACYAKRVCAKGCRPYGDGPYAID